MIAIARPTPARRRAALNPIRPKITPGTMMSASKKGTQLKTSPTIPSTRAVTARPLRAFGFGGRYP